MENQERESAGHHEPAGGEVGATSGEEVLVPYIRADDPPAVNGDQYRLTARQREVALLLTRRLTNEEIANALGLSVHTVRHHVEAVLRKLAVHSRRDVAGKILPAP